MVVEYEMSRTPPACRTRQEAQSEENNEQAASVISQQTKQERKQYMKPYATFHN
jgi:hypothetical protein